MPSLLPISTTNGFGAEVTRLDVIGERLEVRGHPRRRRREERVVLVKHLVRIDQLGELHHLAAIAEAGGQLEERLAGKLIGRQEAVGDRHPAERHERLDGVVTNQALGHEAAVRGIASSTRSVCHGIIGAILPGVS